MKTLFTLAACASLCLSASAATAPQLLSAAGPPAGTGHGDSFTPSFSPDGRFVVFVSSARNLATNGAPSPWLDVYLHDLETGHTELVSANVSGNGGGNGNSVHPSVSSNGLFVTFASDASNLVLNDTNQFTDVFLRDMRSGITTLVSISTNGMENGFGPSGSPKILADGRQIVFETLAWNVFPNDINRFGSDVCLYDRLGRTNSLITVNSSGTGSAIGQNRVGDTAFANSSAMPGNARYVVFQSDATNLLAGINPPYGGVFVRDIENAVTYWASATITDFNIAYAYIRPVITDHGRAFFTVRDNGGNYAVLSYDIQSGISTTLASNILTSSILKVSDDGRFIAIATSNRIDVVNSDTGSAEIVCGTDVTPEFKSWRTPMISGDGQRVVFVAATNAEGPEAVYVYDRASGTRQPVSVATKGGLAEVATLSEPMISGDGRRIAFESRAADLVAGDVNNATDIFVRDLASNTTVAVSAPAIAASTATRRSFIAARGVSDLGRVIAFTSLDHSLAPDDDNTWCSGFVQDRVSGTIRALSTAASRALGTNRLAFNLTLGARGRSVAWMELPAISGNGYTPTTTNIFWLDLESGAERVVTSNPMKTWSPPACLSADGRWLFFATTMPGSGYSQVFRRDMFAAAATNELLSYKIDRSGPATGDSFAPAVTPDGKWVIFVSQSSDVVTNFNYILAHAAVVVRNITTGETRWVNRSSFGSFVNGATNVVISGNSRFVFLQVPQYVGEALYRYDLKTGAPVSPVCTGAYYISVSHDGDVIAYRGRGSDWNISVRDLRTGETTLITTNVLGCCPVGGSGPSSAPLLSGDGRYVVFGSTAMNLVAGDTNNATDIFVHDRVTRTTMIISRNAFGALAAASSSSPVLSPDGRTIVFSSSASDMVAGDYNNGRDLFVLRLGGDDSDLDGMDDDWEVAYFNSLARNGSGDFDGDGASDRQEFQAGTDPANSGSIFRVLTVTGVDGSGRVVLWQSQAGRRYRVEYKNEVGEEFWEELGTVPASASTTSLADPGATEHRYYRVVLLP